MPIRNIDRLARRLEEQAEDELAQLAEVGAEFYTTEQLLRLRGQWEVQYQFFQFFHQWVIRVAVWSPGWLVLGAGLGMLDWAGASLFCFFVFPVSFVVFFLGLWFLHRFFKGKGHLDQVGEMIAEALGERRGEAF